MNTREVQIALRTRFAAPAWALLFEVPDGTGGNKNRSADAVAMSLYPSRGLELNGFEIKVSRSDWQKELADPSKAEAVCKYCDRWWIVAGDPKIVHAGELPPTWGLLVAQGKRLVCKTKAPKLDPVALNRRFLAALLRRVEEQGADKKLLREAERKGFDDGVAHGDRRSGGYKERFEKLSEKLKAFEAAAGFSFDHWPMRTKSGKEIGEVVANVLSGHYDTPEYRLQKMIENVERGLEYLKAELPSTEGDS